MPLDAWRLLRIWVNQMMHLLQSSIVNSIGRKFDSCASCPSYDPLHWQVMEVFQNFQNSLFK